MLDMKVMKGGNKDPIFLALVMFLALFHTVHLAALNSMKQLPSISRIVYDCSTRSTTLFLFNGQEWSPQSNSKFGHPHLASSAFVQTTGDPISSQSRVCIFPNQSTFHFPVSAAGRYFIRLFFYPSSCQGLSMSKALFSVSVGNYTLLKISESSDSTNFPNVEIVKEFCIKLDDLQINITFTPSIQSPHAFSFVNKIEIVPVPLNLYGDVQVPIIGHRSKFLVGNSMALEMMYRINVGRHRVCENDSGMFRVWSEDRLYLFDNLIDTTTFRLKYGMIRYSSLVPAITAPPEVYATARRITNPWSYYNLSWRFPLESGFFYLLRLHFCEIESDVTKENQRVFQVFLNAQPAENHADVIHWSGGIGIPVYRDYIVNFTGDSPQKKLFLLLQLQNVWKTTERGALLNGLEIFKLSDHTNNLAGPFPFVNILSHENRSFIRLIPLTLSCSVLVLLILGYIFLYFPLILSQWRRTSLKKGTSSDNCLLFTLAEIKEATDNFAKSNLIGAGGFGKVFKGYINGGTTCVAIKRCNPTSQQGLHEFQTEITILSQLRHRHLVSLIGYCAEHKEMILVYDFMANGTLRDHLYSTKNPPLPWEQRLKICIDAARGLDYLHAGARHMIIHRDVKTTNILLDKRWVAKVADFGLSKFGPSITSHTHVTTVVKGSFGYLDPEYFRRQKLTEKSDVYSFGVVLMEVLCARPAVLPMVGEDEALEQASLAEWALHCYELGTLHQIIDPYLKGKIDPECFKSFTKIAKMCLANRGSERPAMSEVLWNLELAWQHQEGASVPEEAPVSVTIDSQEPILVGNSDASPGVEFSELMVPTGR